ncbi:MAG: hypothetical protein ABIZ91_15765 [Gemmatimonadaceae bacterium]
MREHILVVAATERELATPNGWYTLCCGVGPVEAAAATAAAIAVHRPAAVLHVGIAGARRESGIEPPSLVIGDSAVYCDLHVPESWAPHNIPSPPRLVAAARRALPAAIVRAIGTSARVGGTTASHTQCEVEAMEGFGVLRAAQLAGIPALEVRAISNHVEEENRTRWRFDDALAAITAATLLLVAELSSCVD